MHALREHVVFIVSRGWMDLLQQLLPAVVFHEFRQQNDNDRLFASEDEAISRLYGKYHMKQPEIQSAIISQGLRRLGKIDFDSQRSYVLQTRPFDMMPRDLLCLIFHFLPRDCVALSSVCKTFNHSASENVFRVPVPVVLTICELEAKTKVDFTNGCLHVGNLPDGIRRICEYSRNTRNVSASCDLSPREG